MSTVSDDGASHRVHENRIFGVRYTYTRNQYEQQ